MPEPSPCQGVFCFSSCDFHYISVHHKPHPPKKTRRPCKLRKQKNMPKHFKTHPKKEALAFFNDLQTSFGHQGLVRDCRVSALFAGGLGENQTWPSGGAYEAGRGAANRPQQVGRARMIQDPSFYVCLFFFLKVLHKNLEKPRSGKASPTLQNIFKRHPAFPRSFVAAWDLDQVFTSSWKDMPGTQNQELLPDGRPTKQNRSPYIRFIE